MLHLLQVKEGRLVSLEGAPGSHRSSGSMVNGTTPSTSAETPSDQVTTAQQVAKTEDVQLRLTSII
jgi:hypothetical protein